MRRYDRLARRYRRKGLARAPSRWRLSASSRRWRSYTLGLLALVALFAAFLFYRGMQRPLAATMAANPPPVHVARGAERTAALPPLELPADEAAHGSAMERWYYSGILASTDGARYAFHMAVFVAAGQVRQTVMNAALIDLQTGRRHDGQLRAGNQPAVGGEAGPAGAVQSGGNDAARPTPQPATGFDFKQAGWQVRGDGTAHVLRADFDGAGLALDLRDSHPAVAHRAAGSATPGLLDFGPSGISYYYSRPRLAAQGWVYLDGETTQVAGEVWFDHQWGDFDPRAVGWNWFGLRLADGSDLMLYQLFDANGAKLLTAGTLSNADGARALAPGEIELTPESTWTSPRSHIDYVLEWQLNLPTGRYQIEPLVADSEFDAGDSSAGTYWKGPVRLSGVNGVELGQGFLEQSGRDRLPAAQAPGR